MHIELQYKISAGIVQALKYGRVTREELSQQQVNRT